MTRLCPRDLLVVAPGRKIYSKMKKVMLQVEQFARLKGVWLQGSWTAAAVTTMWSTICHRLVQHFCTVTRRNGTLSYEKSRQGQLAWRTFYNKLYEDGKIPCLRKIGWWFVNVIRLVKHLRLGLGGYGT